MTRRSRAIGALLLALAPVLAPGVARAQERVVERPLLVSGVEYRGVRFEADTASALADVGQLVVPITLIWPLFSRASIDIGTRYAQATRTDLLFDSLGRRVGEERRSLSGFTDTQARLVLHIVPDAIVLTVAANLPTGKETLEPDRELPVAGAIASDLLPFTVSSFGSGSSFTTGLAIARPIGEWAMGLAGSYRRSQGYAPLSDSADVYQPGGEVRVRVGADRIVGQSRVSLGFTYSSFADDEFGGSRILAPGNRYISQVSWAFPLGNVGLSIYLWDLFRASGRVPLTSDVTEKQNIVALGAVASVRFGRYQLRPQIEYRKHTAGVSLLEHGGRLLSFGARLTVPVGEHLGLVPSLRLERGNVASAGRLIAVTAWNAGVSLRLMP